jgi:chemotaxis protein CheX
MSQISDDMLATLEGAARDVFEKMVLRSIESRAPIRDHAPRLPSSVTGTVAFAGDQCGVMALHSTTEAARAIAGAMLGIPASQVNGEMRDAIGEIANMIAGTFRTRMAASGHRWAISIPTVTTGSDLSTTYVGDVQQAVCPFTTHEGDELFVELVLTQDRR